MRGWSVVDLLRPLVQDLYRGSSSFYLKEVFFSCNEDILAPPLRRVQGEYSTVQVGSYPTVDPVSSYSVRVALESRDRELVEKVRKGGVETLVLLRGTLMLTLAL